MARAPLKCKATSPFIPGCRSWLAKRLHMIMWNAAPRTKWGLEMCLFSQWPTVCATLRSRKQEPFDARIYRSPRPGQPSCTSLRSRNAHEHDTRTILCEKMRENAAPQTLGARCAVETHLDTSQEIYCTGKMPQTKTATHILREPAQWKCMWTKHKSHFMREFAGKKRELGLSTLIKNRPLPVP